jgi:hypothetical protein
VSSARWHIARSLPAIALLGAAVAPAAGAGCTQQAQQVAVRSLERSGRASFVCLAAPNTSPTPALPLERCSAATATSIDDFGQDATTGATTIPHLYALVTQTVRGEVALVDTSASVGNVIDEDPSVPGANFLPVGALPTSIVSTPGGVATFVGIAEIGRESIFALPSNKIRPGDRQTAPELSSWPACRLPSAPGDIALVVDPAQNGATRASCDGAFGDLPPLKNKDHGDLSGEGPGREKLVVELPDLGGFAIVDAQAVLDRDLGSFDPCPIERWVPLKVELPPPGQTGSPPTLGAACVQPILPAAVALPALAPRPAGMAIVGGRMFLGDLAAPVIHVVDLPTPCDPVERAPLLPTDAKDPSRVVVTSRLAATPSPTPALKRYLYALDVVDGSTMVFDVGDGATSRMPLQRPHPEWNPFVPPDRIKFTAPAQDLLVLTRDVPVTDPATGNAVSGVRCSPTPGLGTTCQVTADHPTLDCDVRTLYRTSSDYTTGAGPNLLRGTFAFVLLTSGQIGVIDVDDLDAACRVPTNLSSAAGCSGTGSSLDSSGEVSCNVVEPNSPRSSMYVLSNETAGHHEPGLVTLPLLYDQEGTLIPPGGTPFIRATVPAQGSLPDLSVGTSTQPIGPDGSGTPADTNGSPTYAIAMNLEDPRVHVGDQNWVVSWEGGLADFTARLTNLRLAPGGSPNDGLYDPNGRYCDAGVQSQASVREILRSEGLSEKAADAEAPGLADYVQITSGFATDGDPYWMTVGNTCSYATCNGLFGTTDVPRPERDLRVVEAYQDRMLLELRAPANGLSNEMFKCCFPSDVEFVIRGGGQWIVQGDQAGFLHHVIADPATGACRNSCDPTLARRNGRARFADRSVVHDGDPEAYVGPMFRFAVTPRPCTGATGDCGGAQCRSDQKVCVRPQLARDMNFRFTTQGSFQPLSVNLAASTQDVQPQSLMFVPPTGEIAVTDGALNGLFMVSTQSIQISRQFY